MNQVADRPTYLGCAGWFVDLVLRSWRGKPPAVSFVVTSVVTGLQHLSSLPEWLRIPVAVVNWMWVVSCGLLAGAVTWNAFVDDLGHRNRSKKRLDLDPPIIMPMNETHERYWTMVVWNRSGTETIREIQVKLERMVPNPGGWHSPSMEKFDLKPEESKRTILGHDHGQSLPGYLDLQNESFSRITISDGWSADVCLYADGVAKVSRRMQVTAGPGGLPLVSFKQEGAESGVVQVAPPQPSPG